MTDSAYAVQVCYDDNYGYIRANGLSISPEISINSFRNFHQLALKISTYYKWAKVGLECTSRDSFSAIAGVKIGSFDINFSTEWTVTKLTNATALN